jgi:putative membrane protein
MEWLKQALKLQGSVAPVVVPRALIVGCLGFLVSSLYYYKIPFPWQVFSNLSTLVIFNFVLGLLLVFRTNSAYSRYWEGRQMWGTLVINLRNLSRQIWVQIAETKPEDKLAKISILKLLVAFAIATKLHLRQNPINQEVEKLTTDSQFQRLKTVKNPPLEIALWINYYLQQQLQTNSIHLYQVTQLHELLGGIVNGFTGCERIGLTPIPPAYSIFLKRLLIIYFIALPCQLVENLQFYTGFIVALIAYILLSIEEIGNEIEQPFGTDPNDLPLDAMCNGLLSYLDDICSANLGELLEEPDRASSQQLKN